MSDKALSRLAIAVFVVTVALFAGVVGFSAIHGWRGDTYVPVVAVVWSGVGLVLAVRLPRNAVGWIFLAAVLCGAISGFAAHYGSYGLETAPGSLRGAVWAWWLSTWTWIPGLLLVPTFGLLLFPDGRLPSARWRPVGWLVAGGLGVGMLSYFFAPWQGNEEFEPIPAGIDNPLLGNPLAALHEPLFVIFAVLSLGGILAAAAALVVRYRRSRGDERQQLRWVAFGGVLAVAVYLSGDLITRLPGIGWSSVTLVATVLFPLSILVAVLRFRLYDLGRLVSRTVSYAVLTVLLVGVYVAGVFGLGDLARSASGGVGGDLFVAGSTLAVAALFGPLRRRIQSVVDRRFNRSRYDAAQTVERFARRLRDEVDLDALTDELIAATRASVQPVRVGVWTSSGEAPR